MFEIATTEIENQCIKIICGEFGYTKNELIGIDVNIKSRKIFINISEKGKLKPDSEYTSEKIEIMQERINEETNFVSEILM